MAIRPADFLPVNKQLTVMCLIWAQRQRLSFLMRKAPIRRSKTKMFLFSKLLLGSGYVVATYARNVVGFFLFNSVVHGEFVNMWKAKSYSQCWKVKIILIYFKYKKYNTTTKTKMKVVLMFCYYCHGNRLRKTFLS